MPLSPPLVGSGSTKDVVTVDTTTDVQGATATALASLRGSNGRPSGTLRLGPKTARLGTPLDIDLGILNTPPGDTVWMTDTRERLTLDLPNLFFDAGSRNNIKIHGGFGTQLNVGINGGGAYGETTDGAMTSGQATLTSPALATAGVQVGDWVTVYGAGPQLGIGNLPLKAAVRSVAGNVFTLSDTAGATVAAARVIWMTTGLNLYDLVGVSGRIYGKNYAGVLLGADATGSNPNSAGEANPRHVRTLDLQDIIGIGCGATFHIKSLEAEVGLGSVFSGPVYGDYMGSCADASWSKYAGGIATYGYTSGVPYTSDAARHAENYLWLDRVNNCQFGPIAIGDRSTGACLRISGGDVGTIQKVRATGSSSSNHPSKGIELLDVTSIAIDRIQTAFCPVGVDIVGGGQNGSGAATPVAGIDLGAHLSLTGDNVALQIGPATTQTAPNVRVRARYRTCIDQAVKILAGLTGGRLAIDGRIDEFNSAGSGTTYAIECASAAYVVDVAGLHQRQRSVAAGAINHATPVNVQGVHRARLEGNASGTQAIAHGELPQTPATPGTGVDQRNTDPRPQWVALTVQLNPTVGADAIAKLYVGTWGVGLATGSTPQVGQATRKANQTVGDEHMWVFQVAPYGRWAIDLTNAAVTMIRAWHVS